MGSRMPQQNETSHDTIMIGKIIVEQGLASQSQVEECIESWRDTGGQSIEDLAKMFVERDLVTFGQFKRVQKAASQHASQFEIPGYKMMEMLGAGAMAVVYRAKQVSLDRIVAVKVLPKKFLKDPEYIARFLAEGRAAAKLNHPNIVQAIDVGQSGESHYFVMEYVEGQSVHDRLQEGKYYDEKTALDIIIQTAEALAHAHEKGFIHRDVKPHNIMITKKGIAKLADMGLARQMSDEKAALEEEGKAYGTPYYISPEQIRGRADIDFRADIYGLGATFYHMITGKVPFDGATPKDVMKRHLKEPLVPPDHIMPNVSAHVSEVIEVMMAKERKERYPSTRDLLADLRAVAAGEVPMQAHKTFDLGSLAGAEANTKSAVVDFSEGIKAMEQTPLIAQPIFWILVASGILNIVLLICVIMLWMG
ncbi:MAG: protein kinase [Phycisphaera sp.]|nr:protein kinase [Phycisphaera sp.]